MNKKIQVLVVDDNQDICETLQHLLQSENGIEVVGHVCKSEEALSQIEMLSPDVVLMDVKMPVIDGLELTRQVKLKYQSCNVIMFTMYNEFRAEAINAGAVGYLLKGAKREELIRAIRFACVGYSTPNVSFN